MAAVESAESPEETERTDGEGTPPPRRRRFGRIPGKAVAGIAGLLALALAVPFTAARLGDGDTPRASGESRVERPLTATQALERARATGKEVEAEAERTADATTWARPDGLLRTRVHSDTIRAKTAGGWRPVDTDLRRVKGGYAPKAVNDPLLFSAGTDGGPSTQLRTTDEDTAQWSELVRLTTGGHELTVSWPGPLPEPVVSGPRALYEGVRPGIDLLLTARDSGYSHVLIVHDGDAAADPLLDELRYRLASPSLTFRLDASSRTVQALDAQEQEMAASPTAYAWDSAGTRGRTVGEQPDLVETVSETLNLPGLAGPRPGAHDAVLAAALGEDDVLSITPDTGLLTAEDTVFPVFLDPSFKGHKKNWTLLYKPHPTSSFWNGQNFNDGTNEARVGYEATTGGLSRSVFTFDHSTALNGATVKSAYFRALQTYSWGCSARRYDLWLTGAINSSHTWSNQPTWSRILSNATTGHGYKSSSCPDSWVRMDITSAAQSAADNRWSTITLGLRANSETDTNYWKKFRANGETSPYIEITYNRKPNQPTALTMTPGPDCDVTSPYAAVGKSDLIFRARGSDPDGNLKSLHFRLWRTGDSTGKIFDSHVGTDSNGYANTPAIPWESFTHGETYSWDVRSVDAEGAVSYYAPNGNEPCRFTVDHIAPPSPTVLPSADFPAPGEDGSTWSAVRFGSSGTITVDTESGPHPARYEYSLNKDTYDRPVTPRSDGSAELPISPDFAGPNRLYVRAVDSVGNISRATRYLFYVTPRSGLDAAGDINGDGYPDLLAIDAVGHLRSYPADDRGDVHVHAPGAHHGGRALDDDHWTDSQGRPALISHTGDWYPGDGITDLLARMPDGRLYLHPGDGYGSFDLGRSVPVLLPEGAPDPAALTQLLTAGDVTGDGHPDAIALAGNELWAFSGYTGGAFTAARKLITGSTWPDRDLVTFADISGDGIADLLFRDGSRLKLRHGKPAAGGGVDLGSLATSATSATGQDEIYGASGWTRTNIPMLRGTPDATGDGIPDFWAVTYQGALYLYPGRTTGHGTRYEVGSQSWQTLLTLG